MTIDANCSVCGADKSLLTLLPDETVFCPVHRGPAVPTSPVPMVEVDPYADDVAPVVPLVRDLTKPAPEPVADDFTGYVGDDLTDIPLNTDDAQSSLPMGVRVGIITACSILMSVFDLDAEELAAVLSNGPEAVGAQSENVDVVLRSGVALVIATCSDVFDIQVEEIEAMETGLLGKEPTQTTETA